MAAHQPAGGLGILRKDGLRDRPVFGPRGRQPARVGMEVRGAPGERAQAHLVERRREDRVARAGLDRIVYARKSK